VSRFTDCLAIVKQLEGGLANTLHDTGGPTAYGITQAVYDAWRQAQGLSTQPVSFIGDHEVDTIYFTQYWQPAHCDDLPRPLDCFHFDTAVNMGVESAARLLQTALGTVVIDGVIGPETLAAVAAANPWVLLARYAGVRCMRYGVIAAVRPNQCGFLRGWLRRVGTLLQRL